MASDTLTLRFTTDNVSSLVEEMTARVSELEPAARGEFAKLALELIDEPLGFCVVDADRSAAPIAGEVALRLDPSERFLVLMAALRAGEFNGPVIEGSHCSAPTAGGLATSSVGEGGSSVMGDSPAAPDEVARP